ncbi:MAG: GGDEF domain-containing protein [Gammaproteobacteria bacterium]
MAAASYAMWVSLALVGFATGFFELPPPVFWGSLAGVVLTNLYFFHLLRSGQSLLKPDPSMTFAQVAVALFWVMILMAGARDDRSTMLVVYVIVMLFGIFRLDRLDFLRLSMLALLGYVSVVAWEFFRDPLAFDAYREGLRLLVLAACLLWCVFFGSHVAELRAKLRRKNEALQEAVKDAHRLADRDHLTWAYNRRYIMQMVKTEAARAERRHAPFSIVIFDLDHFKSINDRYGHQIGDRVLTRFADLARRELRAMDVMTTGRRNHCFGRYGGEEFICILPETGRDGARRCAERLRVALAKEVFEEGIRITVSAGISTFRYGEEVDETLRRADDALYRAKEHGRNQVAEEKPLRRTGRSGSVVSISKAKGNNH